MSALSPDLRSAIERQLRSEAERLSQSRRLPLEVDALLRELGLELRFGTDVGSHGNLAYDGGRWIVWVHRSTPGVDLSARERFTVAHEIGHYLIEAFFGVRPTSTSNYWKVESICNQFAAQLLVPDAIAQEARSAATALDLARSLSSIASSTGTSMEVSARRIVPLLSLKATAARVGVLPNGAMEIRWTTGGSSWLPGGRRRRIDDDHPICQSLRERSIRVNWVRRLALSNADVCVRRINDVDFDLVLVES